MHREKTAVHKPRRGAGTVPSSHPQEGASPGDPVILDLQTRCHVGAAPVGKSGDTALQCHLLPSASRERQSWVAQIQDAALRIPLPLATSIWLLGPAAPLPRESLPTGPSGLLPPTGP